MDGYKWLTLFMIMRNFVVFFLEEVLFVIYADDLKVFYPIGKHDLLFQCGKVLILVLITVES